MKEEKWYKQGDKIIKEIKTIDEFDDAGINIIKKSLQNKIVEYENILKDLREQLKKIEKLNKEPD